MIFCVQKYQFLREFNFDFVLLFIAPISCFIRVFFVYRPHHHGILLPTRFYIPTLIHHITVWKKWTEFSMHFLNENCYSHVPVVCYTESNWQEFNISSDSIDQAASIYLINDDPIHRNIYTSPGLNTITFVVRFLLQKKSKHLHFLWCLKIEIV